MRIYIALLHYPMRDKEGDVVATSITNMDLHDISRSCRTFGVKKYFVVNPLEAQREIASRVIRHWLEGAGAEYNANRKEAFEYTAVRESFLEAVKEIEEIEGVKPLIIATSARRYERAVSVKKLLSVAVDVPVLIIFGTGWGFVNDFIELSDYILEPINGAGDFNHLSVRSAVAIILDRINRELEEQNEKQAD